MKKLLFSFRVMLLIVFQVLFVIGCDNGCGTNYELIDQEYRGIIKRIFIVKGQKAYEIVMTKEGKSIYNYNVNFPVNSYLKVGDSIFKPKGQNNCVVFREGSRKFFPNYLHLPNQKYCDSIRKIKSN